MKKLVFLLCMLMSGVVFAQDEDSAAQDQRDVPVETQGTGAERDIKVEASNAILEICGEMKEKFRDADGKEIPSCASLKCDASSLKSLGDSMKKCFKDNQEKKKADDKQEWKDIKDLLDRYEEAAKKWKNNLKKRDDSVSRRDAAKTSLSELNNVNPQPADYSTKKKTFEATIASEEANVGKYKKEYEAGKKDFEKVKEEIDQLKGSWSDEHKKEFEKKKVKIDENYNID